MVIRSTLRRVRSTFLGVEHLGLGATCRAVAGDFKLTTIDRYFVRLRNYYIFLREAKLGGVVGGTGAGDAVSTGKDGTCCSTSGVGKAGQSRAAGSGASKVKRKVLARPAMSESA